MRPIVVPLAPPMGVESLPDPPEAGLPSEERVAQFGQRIAERLDLQALVREVDRAIRELCDADAGLLFLVDPESAELVGEPLSGPGRTTQRVRLKNRSSVVVQVAFTTHSVATREPAPELEPLLGLLPGSLAAVPLLRMGDVLGVICAVRLQGRSPVSARQTQTLDRLARHLAPALHHLQTFESLRQAQAALLEAKEGLEGKVEQRTAQLVRAKREWESTFDAIREPIAIQDGFTVRRGNRAYAEAAGVPVQQLPGMKCHQLLANRDTPCEGCPLLDGGDTVAGEVHLAEDGTSSVSGFWTGEPRKSSVVMHYRDLTSHRALETKLRESERLAAVGQLASGAAHEINNPLAFVISNLNSLKDWDQETGEVSEAERGERERERLAIIEESLQGARRVQAIIAGLRELSRLEVGQAGEADLNASVQRGARTELGALIDRVELRLSAVQRAAISPLHLDQVLGHILRNARQAVGAQGRIYLETRDEGDQVVLSVRDEGCGIKREHLGRVFEPFFTTRGVGGGLGLGLTAAYGIVRRYGGAIRLDSDEGQGTTVELRLPGATTIG